MSDLTKKACFDETATASLDSAGTLIAIASKQEAGDRAELPMLQNIERSSVVSMLLLRRSMQ